MVYTIISNYSKLPTGWMACLPFTAAHVNWWPPHQMENSRFECYIFIWLVVSTPLKNMKVSWDYCSQYMEKNVPNHQPVIFDIASHVFQPFSQPIILLTFWWHDDMIISIFFNPVFNPHLLPLHRQWFFCLHRHDLTGGLAASSKNTTYKRRQLGMDLFMRTRGISKQWGMLSMGSFNDILSISLESLELIIETWLIRIKVIFHGARHTLW